MNIPLEPTKPLEGVASPAPPAETPPEAPKPRQYVPRALYPRRMWAIIRTLVLIRKDVEPLRIAQSIVPRVRVGHGARLVGFPGSGVFHGNTNVAKSVTYRAVPNVDFNTERNARRAKQAKEKLQNAIGGKAWLSKFGVASENPTQ